MNCWIKLREDRHQMQRSFVPRVCEPMGSLPDFRRNGAYTKGNLAGKINVSGEIE